MHCIDPAGAPPRPRPRERTGVAGAAPFTGKSAAAGFLAVAAALLLAGCHTPMPPDRRSPPSHVPNTPDAPGALAAPYRRPAMTMDEYRLQFAARLMAANPGITYTEPAPNPLLAIPVLEIEVNGDGSVRHIEIVRTPTQATDTVQIAIDAVRRAAPFGDATHLPRPWKFTEVFLFDDERRFKPRILD